MMLGGELHFDSELGVGSTFSLFFQAARADPPTDLNTGAGRPMAFRKTYSFGNDHQLEGSDVFEIPRRQSEPSPVKGPPWAASGGRPSGKQRLGIGYRVLVVEDNILNQKILRKQLTAQGCETVTANNGEEALEILRNGEMFTIVLMDMEMPVSLYDSRMPVKGRGKLTILIIDHGWCYFYRKNSRIGGRNSSLQSRSNHWYFGQCPNRASAVYD